MSNADRLLTHHVVMGKTADGMSQHHLSLRGPSEGDTENIVKACQTTDLLASDISALCPTAHPVLSLIGRDLEKRIAEIARALREISDAIADTSTDISAQDVQEWAAELRDEAVLAAISYYDLETKIKIFSRSMKAVRSDRLQFNKERSAAG
ncbi:MAG: hypothetical protein ACYCQM_04650 [Acidithiobacillus sp.]|jgi:hypothetical protein